MKIDNRVENAKLEKIITTARNYVVKFCNTKNLELSEIDAELEQKGYYMITFERNRFFDLHPIYYLVTIKDDLTLFSLSKHG